MRDLVEDPHPEFTAAMMADLTGRDRPAAASAEPVGGDFVSGRSSVHAGASEGVRRRAQTIGTRVPEETHP